MSSNRSGYAYIACPTTNALSFAIDWLARTKLLDQSRQLRPRITRRWPPYPHRRAERSDHRRHRYSIVASSFISRTAALWQAGISTLPDPLYSDPTHYIRSSHRTVPSHETAPRALTVCLAVVQRFGAGHQGLDGAVEQRRVFERTQVRVFQPLEQRSAQVDRLRLLVGDTEQKCAAAGVDGAQ